MRQSDWSGGYGQQVWSDSTKFNEYYNVKYQNSGELTIDQKPDNWYDRAWKYRKKITFNNKDQNEDLKNFVVLIKLDHKVNIDYRKTQNKTGFDLRFIDSDGTTLLNHEIERWDQEGSSYIWVKVPQIDAAADVDYIWMYYGNPDAVDIQDPAKVWQPDYRLVMHMDQDPSSGVKVIVDSSDKGNHGIPTKFNGPPDNFDLVDGKIGKAINILSNKYYVAIDDNDTLDFGTNTNFTIEVWANLAGSTRMFEKRVGTGGQGYNLIDLGTTGVAGLITGPTSGNCQIRTTSTIANTGWKYVAAMFTRNPSCAVNDMPIYIDGARAQTNVILSAEVMSANINTTQTAGIGYRGNNISASNGTIDEVRISAVARSALWFKVEYKNQTDQFATYGYEELRGGELISSIFDAGQGNNWGYLVYEAEEPEKTAAKVKVRTGNNMYLADAADFATCESIINKTDISNNKCVRDGDRYIQYQAILESTEVNKTPIFKSISITDFLPSQIKPVVQGISTVVTSPKPTIENLDFATPKPAPTPRPSPSLTPKPYWLNPIVDFFEVLFN